MSGYGKRADSNNSKNNGRSLSDLELSVLNLLIEGNSIAEIAQLTGYSEYFVASILENTRRKMGAKSLVHAVVDLLKNGTYKL